MKDSHGQPAGTRGPDRAARERFLTGRAGAGLFFDASFLEDLFRRFDDI